MKHVLQYKESCVTSEINTERNYCLYVFNVNSGMMQKTGFGLTSVFKTGYLPIGSGCWCKPRDMVFSYFSGILEKPLFAKKVYIEYQTLKY